MFVSLRSRQAVHLLQKHKVFTISSIMATSTTALSVILLIHSLWIPRCLCDDFAFMVNMSAIDKLQRPFLPMVYKLLIGTKINVPTIEGPLLLDIDPIHLLYVNADSFLVRTDPKERAIQLSIVNLDVLVRRVKVNVHQTIGGSSISCIYYTTPNISHWNFSMAIQGVTHSNESRCNLEIYTNRSKVHIVEGHTDFLWQFDSSFCRTAFNLADRAINIEKTVKKTLSKEIVRFIDKELQNALNDIFAEINVIEIDETFENISWIELCFSESRVGADNVVLGATFTLTDTEPITTTTSTTTNTPKDDSDSNPQLDIDTEKEGVDNLLLYFMVLVAALCWIWGFCCWFCVRKCYKANRDSDEYEKQWMEQKEKKEKDELMNEKVPIQRIESSSQVSPLSGKKTKGAVISPKKFNPLPSICNFEEAASTSTSDGDDGHFQFATNGGDFNGNHEMNANANGNDGDNDYVAPLSSGNSYHRKLRHHPTPAKLQMVYSPLSLEEAEEQEDEI